MGFCKFASRKRGRTPLFYSLERQRNPDRKNPTYTSVGNKLAEWVRSLGIKDPLVKPNHGWRHRFKAVGLKVKMSVLLFAVPARLQPGGQSAGGGQSAYGRRRPAATAFLPEKR
jgi:hypothetical protein